MDLNLMFGKAGTVGIIIVAILLILREIKPLILKNEKSNPENRLLVNCPLESTIKESLIDILNNQTKILDRMDSRQEVMQRDILVIKERTAHV
jgi:hypothetical protein